MPLTTEQVALWKQTAKVVRRNASDMEVKILQDRIIELADEVLACREAQPVAIGEIGEIRLGELDDVGCYPGARVVCLHDQADWDNFSDGTKLYTAPPAPAVPDGLKRAVTFYEQVKRENTPIETGAWKDAVNWVLEEACRAAMLGGAK